MGAGVVKAPAGGTTPTPRTSRSSKSQPKLEDMSCESCSKEFTFLKRKKLCCECGCYHCSSCVLKDPSSTLTSPRRRCHKCLHLLSGNFTRHDLAIFKIKDLRNFLRRRNVNTHNCKEKQDLIELVLNYSCSSQHRQEQELYRRNLEQLQQRRLAQVDSSQSDSSVSMPSTPSLSERGSPRVTPQRNHPDPPSEPATGTPTPPPRRSRQARESVPETPAQDSAEPTTMPSTSETSGEQPEPAPTTAQPPKPQLANRARLSDIEDVDAVESLSVRQLKEILATNYVDYKGCCEKWELIKRVQRLWNQKKSNDNYAQELENLDNGEPVDMDCAGTSGDTDVCKVCMDAIIDCVLLECGHMVSCTKCGKQLSECPICRQYVVRVVHTFKA